MKTVIRSTKIFFALATLLFVLFSLLGLGITTLQGDAYAGLRSYIFSSTTPDSGIPLAGSGISFHKLTWTISGTVTTCSVAVDSSADGVAWTAGGVISAQACTSNGATSIVGSTPSFIRINPTTFSGTGSVTAVWTGYVNNPLGNFVTTAQSYFVCAKAVNGTCVYNGDAGTVAVGVCPDDSCDGLTKATPVRTPAGAAAKINGKTLLNTTVTFNFADVTNTGSDCYLVAIAG